MDYDQIIRERLRAIEQRENVKILYAVESGSRAWGFASPDSDYDVRFVYVRPQKAYLQLQPDKDFIDWELNEVLDINGWDVKKTLQQCHKSNATLFEWINSPIVYHTTREWEAVRRVSEAYFSSKVAMYHYYGMANKNYREYLLEDMIKYKKYFYVLRPILACKWIEERGCPPPVLFSALSDSVLEMEMRPLVGQLVEKKKMMAESDKGSRIDELNAYIEEKLVKYKALAEAMQDDRKGDWTDLNDVFLQLCGV